MVGEQQQAGIYGASYSSTILKLTEIRFGYLINTFMLARFVKLRLNFVCCLAREKVFELLFCPHQRASEPRKAFETVKSSEKIMLWRRSRVKGKGLWWKTKKDATRRTNHHVVNSGGKRVMMCGRSPESRRRNEDPNDVVLSELEYERERKLFREHIMATWHGAMVTAGLLRDRMHEWMNKWKSVLKWMMVMIERSENWNIRWRKRVWSGHWTCVVIKINDTTVNAGINVKNGIGNKSSGKPIESASNLCTFGVRFCALTDILTR